MPGIVHAGGVDPSERWYGQQAVYRISLGNFVRPLALAYKGGCVLWGLVLVLCEAREPSCIPAHSQTLAVFRRPVCASVLSAKLTRHMCAKVRQ